MDLHHTIEDCLFLWTGILRLRDWDIEIQVVRDLEMSREGKMARIEWDLSKRIAKISLLEEDLVDRSGAALPPDMERDIVHELLHLHFAPLNVEDDSPEDLAQEQAIHAISMALISEYRQSYAVDKERVPSIGNTIGATMEDSPNQSNRSS